MNVIAHVTDECGAAYRPRISVLILSILLYIVYWKHITVHYKCLSHL